MGTSVPGGQGSIIGRMIGAAMLNVNTYEEVEADTTATGQAGVVVGLVAVCGGIGALLAHGGIGQLVISVCAAFIGWLIWAAVTFVVGTRMFGGTATWGELLRTLGFAQAPGVLNILRFIPGIGMVIAFVVGIWTLVTGVVAIRQALDFSTGKAVLTAIISVIVVMVVMFGITLVLGAVFGITMAGAGMLTR